MRNELKHKRGLITVSKELLDIISIEEIKLLFSNFYPVNIELIQFGKLRYYGYSEHFDICDDELMLNEYVAIFTKENENEPFKISF